MGGGQSPCVLIVYRSPGLQQRSKLPGVSYGGNQSASTNQPCKPPDSSIPAFRENMHVHVDEHLETGRYHAPHLPDPMNQTLGLGLVPGPWTHSPAQLMYVQYAPRQPIRAPEWPQGGGTPHQETF